MEEVVALDRRTEHPDLASDSEQLASLKARAALSPEERAAQASFAEIARLAQQTVAATIAARSGQADPVALLPQLDQVATQAAADEVEGSPWLDLAHFIRACGALLRGETPELTHCWLCWSVGRGDCRGSEGIAMPVGPPTGGPW